MNTEEKSTQSWLFGSVTWQTKEEGGRLHPPPIGPYACTCNIPSEGNDFSIYLILGEGERAAARLLVEDIQKRSIEHFVVHGYGPALIDLYEGHNKVGTFTATSVTTEPWQDDED